MTRGSKKILDPPVPRSPGRHRAGRADQVRPVGPAREFEAARATDEAVAADLAARGGVGVRMKHIAAYTDSPYIMVRL